MFGDRARRLNLLKEIHERHRRAREHLEETHDLGGEIESTLPLDWEREGSPAEGAPEHREDELSTELGKSRRLQEPSP